MVASKESSKVSARKIRANRSNARKSTGPKSSEGKSRVSRNAFKHGVYCSELLLPGESKAMLALHREQFIRSLVPMDAMELLLVERIVTAQWKLRRLNLLEQGLHETQLDKLRLDAERHIAELDDEIAYREETAESMRRRGKRAEEIEDFFAERQSEARERMSESTEELKEFAEEMDARCAAEPDPQELADSYRKGLRDLLAARTEPTWVQTMQATLGQKLEGLDSLERMSRLEQRLESSIHRNMRELLRLREHRAKHPQPEPVDEMLCASPYATRHSELLDDAADEAMEMLRIKATEEEDDRKCNPDEDLSAEPDERDPESDRTKADNRAEPERPKAQNEKTPSPKAPGTE